ncbi:DUF6444 domain-containing protein [Streptomyces sp. NPDC020681]|uniref:DUF6444 domain-containing protein n=1 Tax=Streptomyces sp. NPDC020681 TaxID=3365083 RepID=UPI00379D9680
MGSSPVLNSACHWIGGSPRSIDLGARFGDHWSPVCRRSVACLLGNCLVGGRAAERRQTRAELAETRARIADLQVLLGQNSKNSSNPPSSDGLAEPAPKFLRGRSGRPERQEGVRLAQVADPDP